MFVPVRCPKQLWLFPPTKPLHDTIDPAFFRALPRDPGVYFFHDADEVLLYIGKAKSLRDRLNSYRYVHPDRDSRKTWRLVNEIRRIEVEVCQSHEAALLLETQLIRKHRPRFNRVNTWPWAAVYIGLREEGGTVHLRVDRSLDARYEWFGAFKSFSIYAFSAFQRALRYIADPARAPLGWFDGDTGRSFTVTCDSRQCATVRAFLRGDSEQFLANLVTARATDCRADLAGQNLVLNDLVLLEEFYQKGPLRNRRIKPGSGFVTPEELVDWLAVQSA